MIRRISNSWYAFVFNIVLNFISDQHEQVACLLSYDRYLAESKSRPPILANGFLLYQLLLGVSVRLLFSLCFFYLVFLRKVE